MDRRKDNGMRTPERIRQVKREYMQRARLDPEKRNRWNELRRGKHKATAKAYSVKLRDRHFFKWRARNWSRHGRVTAWQLMCLWHKQRGKCALSGKRLGRDAHLDHIVPKSQGGVGTIDNIRWLDPVVNQARQDMTDEAFLAMCNQVVEWIGRRIMEQL